jgi:hypothetical protein
LADALKEKQEKPATKTTKRADRATPNVQADIRKLMQKKIPPIEFPKAGSRRKFLLVCLQFTAVRE